MGVTDNLRAAGFKAEKSTAGDKPILKGVYKVTPVEGKLNEPNDYGHSYMEKFKITEVLAGHQSKSAFPEFAGFFDVDKQASSAKKGIAKLINGFLSVGITIDQSTDDAMYASIAEQRGSAELFVTAYKKKAKKNVGTKETPNWVDNPDGEDKQDFAFMTEKNAIKEAAKQNASKNTL